MKGTIDNPTAITETKNLSNINVFGWILDDDKVAKVEVIVDDKVMGEALYGGKRNDVLAVYPEYNSM